MSPPPSNLRTRTAYAYAYARGLEKGHGKVEEKKKKQGARVLGSYCNEVMKIKKNKYGNEIKIKL